MGAPDCFQLMQKVQNTAACLILWAPCHQKCTSLLQQLYWLPISERIKYNTACMCNIFLNCCTFTVLPALSALHQAHACSNSNASTTKPTAFVLSHTSVSTSGTYLPQDIRHSVTLSSFKRKLKTFLFSECSGMGIDLKEKLWNLAAFTDNFHAWIFQLRNTVLPPCQSRQCV